jgi:hypothetical protein
MPGAGARTSSLVGVLQVGIHLTEFLTVADAARLRRANSMFADLAISKDVIARWEYELLLPDRCWLEDEKTLGSFLSTLSAFIEWVGQLFIGGNAIYLEDNFTPLGLRVVLRTGPRDFLLRALDFDGCLLEHLLDIDEEVVVAALESRTGREAVAFASVGVLKDLVGRYPHWLRYNVPREVLLSAVAGGVCISHTNAYRDKEVVLAAVTHKGAQIKYASWALLQVNISERINTSNFVNKYFLA